MFVLYNYTRNKKVVKRAYKMDIIIQIIIQALGGLGVIASIIAFQTKKHNQILWFKTLNEFLFAIQYVLLGAYTGMAMNLVGCVRNIIFTKQVEKNKKTTLSAIILCVMFTVFGIATWQGFKSLLIVLAKVLSTVAYSNKNTTFVRAVILFTSICWLIYNAYVFSIAGVLCEAFTIISVMVGMIRFDIIPYIKNKRNCM